MPASESVTINFGKVNAIIGVLAVLVVVTGAWATLNARVSSAETVAGEARTEARAARVEYQSINIRLERMQTILERLDAGLTEKVKAEIRAALNASNGGR